MYTLFYWKSILNKSLTINKVFEFNCYWISHYWSYIYKFPWIYQSIFGCFTQKMFTFLSNIFLLEVSCFSGQHRRFDTISRFMLGLSLLLPCYVHFMTFCPFWRVLTILMYIFLNFLLFKSRPYVLPCKLYSLVLISNTSCYCITIINLLYFIHSLRLRWQLTVGV